MARESQEIPCCLHALIIMIMLIITITLFFYIASFRSTFFKFIIISIMLCRNYGYPWPSLAISPYHSSPLAGLQGYIPYPHIAAVCMYELLLLGHMRGSIGVHHLWARLASPAVSCMSGSSSLDSFRDGRQVAV